MRFKNSALLTVWLVASSVLAQSLETKPNDPYFEKFLPRLAPKPFGLILREGDQLAICGDSITEQKMYSRIIETYLTVCAPELKIGVRQYGWGGERAPGFLNRMTNDVLRFHPTIATTCYGMNDHEYRRYDPAIGETYQKASLAIVQSFKANGVRVIQGSPGIIGKKPKWSKDTYATAESSNLSLCELRNIGVEIAENEKVGFADVFWPMFQADYAAWRTFGPDYAVAGKDGVHPDWSGQTIMAYAFLKSFGLQGNLGTFTMTLGGKKALASPGHEAVSCKDDTLTIQSRRYPFCAVGATNKDDSIRSAMTLVPFNEELNRLILVVKNVKKGKNYKVIWGTETKTYSGEQLARGINLAADYPVNPFSEAFAKVDAAVAAKQTYETRQIKEIFRSSAAQTDREGTVVKTETERTPLVEAIKTAFVPVTHTIKITAE